MATKTESTLWLVDKVRDEESGYVSVTIRNRTGIVIEVEGLTDGTARITRRIPGSLFGERLAVVQ